MTGDMETKGDGEPNGPLRTSDRLRQRSKIFTHTYIYYNPNMRRKNKAARRRTAAARIVNFLRPRNRPIRNTTSNLVSTNLRRSTRKRKISINLDDYETDSSRTEDVDLMQPRYRSKNRVENNASQDDFSTPRGLKKNGNVGSIPRREGLRPRRSAMSSRGQPYHESEGDRDTYEGQVAHDETENGNDVDGRDDVESEEGDEIEEDGEDEDAEEQEGRRRYDLRNRAEVRRFSPDKEGKQRPQSPRRVLHQGMNGKNKEARRGSSRVHKRHRLARPEDSDDSLLVDELDQGPATPWMRSSSRSGAPWLFGGLDLHGSSSWGLNVASSGWGHQGDTLTSLNTGIQTAGPSSKGGADIQPIQVDDGISFDDIGGLSEYIDALKEMVFFPLLYPDFFASYHITPPRGVLLCGPPGTGKTLIARALACAASRAGQKVSFYMRKGADVLSKWVGEAERQLKLLFEEAQKNQPSIIFFDEIDGLAPVRSSKQEQIHNSIVSTLLALMDGLDSRGQVVLIGATNRIDAIDGALRRPGRFDREFVFPLPGSEARAEILDIHTRKWKAPPSKELKTELAASCVGYCGADIKALCTEAAIRAFREKYPQVYTSDDKFLIDVDSIRVEKYHFLEAMSTITPAAHRGSVVISRPLSSVVAPCLESQVLKIMKHIFDIFPFSPASDVGSTTLISYGNSMSLVYRPRLLICGDETVGLDHVGPAVLHQLEKFPVHSLGLPSLLSDPSAKSPEEALVHIFSEARRATPSVLYLPQFQLWWDTAHHQLKAVLLSLLDELPSDFPILLLGTSSVAFSDLEEDAASLFGDRNVYRVEELSLDDRSKFVDKLVEDILSISSKESEKSKDKPAHSELPKVPREVNGPKASELQAKAEAEQHALRRLRMCLRDVCNRILYDKRFTAFHYPVTDEDAPNYHSIVHNPMDVATLLQRVDCGLYLTRFAFLQDVDLIVSNAKAYNGEDYNGARIVSRACELRDVVHGMLSQMDPALVSFCDKISAQGGPVAMPDDVGGLGYSTTPVVQQVVTRTSARLRNVQPEVNLSQSYEVLRRQKKNNESEQAAVNVATTREKSQAVEQETPKTVSLQGPSCVEQKSAEAQKNVPANELLETSTSSFLVDSNVQDVVMKDADISDQVNHVQQCLKRRIENFGIPQLERLYAQLVRRVMAEREKVVLYDKCYILKVLSSYAEDDVNF